MEVFGPSVAVVADEFYYAPDSVAASLVLATIVDVLSNVPHDDCSFEDLFQLSYVIDRGAGFVDSLPTPGYFVALWV